ncbi:hypothetical protein KIN20_013775 [Parelaphostrongylus tenuis]|uniref:Uncharacterized protein n=1 Tax=Parelaphostrongylus tenuis TaxID=148309 RepID=A0AAD5QNZ8_PARTN|nr:hypothetical protein KIN20_013775 [Parelaphostrongylus tenuis]
MLEEVGRLTTAVKSIETAEEMLEEEVKPLTVAVESVETAQQMVGEEAEPLTALSNTALETALSGYTYSEYSLPPSETNVEIEPDVIAEASPLSTAVSGSVSWHSMLRPETEVEPPPILYVGGIRVVDSIECLHRLPSAELRPVENFDNLNAGLICAGGLTSGKETDQGNYEYSYYSNGPSETDVTMNDMDKFN